jgi:DNA ligase-1
MAYFLQLAELAEQMAATASRLKKRAAIAEAITAIHAGAPGSDDAGLFALYVAGEAFAESDPRKLSAGGALLSKAVLAVSGAGEAALTAAYRLRGDLGAAAFDLFAGSVEGSAVVGSASEYVALTLSDVSAAFGAMAAARTTAMRAGLVEGLLLRATPIEVKYLVKLMLGDMRIGVKQSLVEEAIAHAASRQDSPVTAAEVRHAVMLEADLGSAVRRAFAGTLGEARMRLFHPLGFMLASPVESAEEAAARFQEASMTDDRPATIHAFLEDKYDGMRAQLHCGDPEQPGRVAIYSRNREDITASFPELAEAFAHVDCGMGGPLILDGEILAWDFGLARGEISGREERPALGSLKREEEGDLAAGVGLLRALPFAVLGERIGRKRISNELRTRVPVIFMAFDLLYVDGELTLALPLRMRRHGLEAIAERLRGCIVSPLQRDEQRSAAQSSLFQPVIEECAPAVPRLVLSPSRLVESAEDIDRAYIAARARSNEGVMIKGADSLYQPGRRGLSWVKLKRELATLDVVVTGAEYGHGKRAGLLSDYTFAVREGGSGDLLNVGKAYSGVTDAEIAQLTRFLKAHTLEDQEHFRIVEPLIVLEVAFNNIMRSTRHASGFALRFPRILRLRSDKPVDEIDTLERVEEIYQSQVDKPSEMREE